MAGKPLRINLDDIRKLGALQCTEKEIASFLGIGLKRFRKLCIQLPEIMEAYEEGQDSGKVSLRRKQFRLAGINASMAIHLGKNILGQKDSVSHEHTGKDGGPIETMDLSQLSKDDRAKLREIIERSSKPAASS